MSECGSRGWHSARCPHGHLPLDRIQAAIVVGLVNEGDGQIGTQACHVEVVHARHIRDLGEVAPVRGAKANRKGIPKRSTCLCYTPKPIEQFSPLKEHVWHMVSRLSLLARRLSMQCSKELTNRTLEPWINTTKAFKAANFRVSPGPNTPPLRAPHTLHAHRVVRAAGLLRLRTCDGANGDDHPGAHSTLIWLGYSSNSALHEFSGPFCVQPRTRSLQSHHDVMQQSSKIGSVAGGGQRLRRLRHGSPRDPADQA